MKKKKQAKIYVVWKGRKPGIYKDWEECESQVKGFPGAQFKSFPSMTAAQSAMKEGFEKHKASAVARQKVLFLPPGPLPDSYCVDAACSGNPGKVEFRCVHTSNGKEIFHEGPFDRGTNNIGEFLAIVHALQLLMKKKINKPIYSDSVNAMAWVKIKKCRTTLRRDERNEHLFDMIGKAEDWLEKNEYPNRILKWDTSNWGEIPADFGRK